MMKLRSLLVIIFLIFSQNIISRENEKKEDRIKISEWLQLGPAPVTMLENRVYRDKRARADHDYLDVTSIVPQEGKKVRWKSGSTINWIKAKSLSFKPGSDSIYYFANYPDASKRLKAIFIISGISESFIDIYFDGRRIKKDFDKKSEIVKADLDMLNSKHILLLKVFVPAGKNFSLNAEIKGSDQVRGEALRFSTDLYRRVNFRNILNMVRVSDTRLSPDGKLAFVTLKRTRTDGKADRWNEILKVSSGEMIYSNEGAGSLKGARWLKDSSSLTYKVTRKEKTSLFVLDVNTGKRELILRGVKNFSDYWWSPDNSFLIYTKYFKKDTGKGFKYVNEIPERAKNAVYKNSIHLFYPEGGVTHKIGTKDDDFNYPIISPDSKKVIIQKSVTDNKNRPYYRNIFYLLDIETLSLDKFLESNLVSPVMWSPDSLKILMTGGPSSFSGTGNTLKKGVIPNEYDSQAFVYDPDSGKAVPLTKDFDPSINSAFWRSMRTIYFSVKEGSYENLYRYDIPRKRFTRIKTSVDVTGKVYFSGNGRTALFWGSGSANHHKLYRTDLSSGRTSVLKDYNKDDFEFVKFGKIENWNYKKSDGKIIYGRIYYPVDFDIQKKYPCIVYYYGGTSPVERSFGGRYPMNWYAANGYVVYVLQPSGTVGYGQAFSAAHVNDWGKTTSGEVISATRSFLVSHPFVDPGRVGAMGASYGGFLTQYLAAKTDIFSAFISHAGISALSSYWGVGDWGYTYSGIATAKSFPWNRKDIYVDRSPLFMADRINTPLLLLHGDIDNNVPPGESYQMYAALKLLGKEVALITLEGQAHWILNYSKRVLWMKTIMAWFDKWLKGETYYWSNLYSKYMD